MTPATQSKDAGEAMTLLPCPFCGSDDISVAYEGQPAQRIFLSCMKCFACGPVQILRSNEIELATAWNTRKAQQ